MKKTSIDCKFGRMDNGEIFTPTTRISKLKDHHTLAMEPVDGEMIVGCSLNSNYNLGTGFNEFNDFKMLVVGHDRIEGWGFSMFGSGYDGNWWMRTPWKIIVKKNYTYTW